MTTFISNPTVTSNPNEVQHRLDVLAKKHSLGRDQHKVSTKYQYVESDHLVDTIIERMPEGAQLRLHTPRLDTKSTKHLIEVLMPETVNLFGTACRPRALIWNSYLGECSLKIQLGLFRFVCNNGLVIGDSEYTLSARHQGQTIRDQLDQFDTKIAATIEHIVSGQYVSDIIEQTEESVALQATDIVRQLHIPESAKLKTTYQLVHQDLIREEDKGGRIWDLYNIVNENIRVASQSTLAAEGHNMDLLNQIRRLAA